ncbi:MAG: STAS domain-containing protein [Deltaproteobacteria bacterium]
MPIRHDVLRVYETGPRIVIGFGEAAVLDQNDVDECREEIRELVRLHDCKSLVFDLMNVRYIPSVVLGLLASLTRMGIEVQLYNISAEVRNVLQVTQLGRLFRFNERVC